MVRLRSSLRPSTPPFDSALRLRYAALRTALRTALRPCPDLRSP
ncbi:MAG: hypothetical protein ABR545_11405 [Cyclonatronaceae bacterium]